jgi:hypothetical protein
MIMNGTVPRPRSIGGGKNHAKRAPSRCSTCDASWIATAVVLALSTTGSGKQSFAALLRSTKADQGPLAAGLAQLRADDYVLQNVHGDFQLSSKGLNLVDEGRRRGGQARRRAA